MKKNPPKFLTKILRKGHTANKRCPFCESEKGLNIQNTGRFTYYKNYKCLECYAEFKYQSKKEKYELYQTVYYYLNEHIILGEVECRYNKNYPLTTSSLRVYKGRDKILNSLTEELPFPLSKEKLNELSVGKKIKTFLLFR